jgi:hypothetical protein
MRLILPSPLMSKHSVHGLYVAAYEYPKMFVGDKYVSSDFLNNLLGSRFIRLNQVNSFYGID